MAELSPDFIAALIERYPDLFCQTCLCLGSQCRCEETDTVGRPLGRRHSDGRAVAE